MNSSCERSCSSLDSHKSVLGRQDRSYNVTTTELRHPYFLIASIAETFEDLGERDRALMWIARAFDAGVTPSYFQGQPPLRELIADDRYQQLAEERVDQS